MKEKEKGLHHPERPHEHWHIDTAYISICDTFYYLCGILDGHSRYVVHWDIRASMTQTDDEIVLQLAGINSPKPRPGSSSTTVRSMWPRASRNTSGRVT